MRVDLVWQCRGFLVLDILKNDSEEKSVKVLQLRV